MQIFFPVLRSYNVTNLSKKVIERLRVRVILLMEIRLKGHSGVLIGVLRDRVFIDMQIEVFSANSVQVYPFQVVKCT